MFKNLLMFCYIEKAAAKGNNQTYSLDTGTPLDLTCVAEINENDPSVRFLWIKDSIVLRNISITPSSDEVSDMYRISKIGGADEGTITCIPSNDIGNKRTVTFTVAINGPSEFIHLYTLPLFFFSENTISVNCPSYLLRVEGL